jgi:ATP-binding cassette subfamily B (MDR/TAP) protein 1
MGESLIKRFDGDLLKRLQKLGAKRSIIRSLEQSSVYFALFLTYSLAFWFGGIQVRGGLETGHVLTVSHVKHRETYLTLSISGLL